MSMNYLELAKLIKERPEDVLYFYDRKVKAVVPLYLQGSNDDVAVYRMEADKNNFIAMPRIIEEAIYYEYAMTKVSDKEAQEYLLEATGARSMKNRLNKYNLSEDYDHYLESECQNIIRNWAYTNELDDEEAKDSDFEEIYGLAMSLKDKKPWKHFADMDYFKIHYQGDDIYYVILGNSGECHGVEMFYNEMGYKDLCLEVTLSQLDPSSIYPMVARNAITVYFDPYDEIVPPEQEFIDKMGEDITDELYPTFMVTHISNMPREVKTVSECFKYKKGLTALNMFMDVWNKKPRKMDEEVPTHYAVEIDDRTNAVTFKKNNKAFEPDPFPYQIPMIRDDEIEDLRKNLRTKGGLAYADIKAIPAGDKDNLKPYFMILIYDCGNERILNTTPHEAIDGDYILGLVRGLHEDLLKERIPSKVLIRDPLVSIILTILYGDKLSIDIEAEPFDPIEEVTMGLFDSFSDEHTMDIPKDEYVS